MASPEEDTAALTVAMEIFRTSVADLRTSLAATTLRFSRGSEEGSGTSRVPAFDRPQPVVIVGPNPLPVSGGGAGAVARGPQLPGSKKKGGNPLADVGSLIAAKFASVLGPLALFGQILNSNAAGFQLVGSAIKILATTLAPIFLPVMIVIAAAILDMSEDIQKRVLPALRSWAKFVFGTILPVLHKLAEWLLSVIDGLARFFRWLMKFEDKNSPEATEGNVKAVIADLKDGRSEKEIIDNAKAQGVREAFIKDAIAIAKARIAAEASDVSERAGGLGLGGLMKPRPGAAAGDVPGEPVAMRDARRAAAARDAGVRPGDPAGGRRGLDDVLASLRASIMPKASISGFEGIYSKVQLAASNADPLEARMLDTLTKILGEMEAARGELRGPMRPVFGERP